MEQNCIYVAYNQQDRKNVWRNNFRNTILLVVTNNRNFKFKHVNNFYYRPATLKENLLFSAIHTIILPRSLFLQI